MDFVTLVLRPLYQKAWRWGRGVENCPKLRDVIYERRPNFKRLNNWRFKKITLEEFSSMVKWKNEDEHEACDRRECEEDPEEDEVNLRRSI